MQSVLLSPPIAYAWSMAAPEWLASPASLSISQSSAVFQNPAYFSPLTQASRASFSPASSPVNSPLLFQPSAAQHHPEAQTVLNSHQRIFQGLAALGLIASSLYLRKFPVKASRFELLPTDWRIWAQTLMGSQAVNSLNQATDSKPAPWLNALETVAIVSPLISGPLKAQTWRQLPLLAIAVPLLVQATQFADEKAQHFLDANHSTIPRWIPTVGLSITSTLLGLFGLRGVIKTSMYQRYVQNGPSALTSSATSSAVGAEAAAVCSRCGGVHLICVNEIADVMAGLGNWLKQRFDKQVPKS
jgi:hypothetical protein